MSGVKSSVLAQKIERAKPAAPASSALGEFIAAFGKAAGEALGELLSSPLEASLDRSDARLPDSVAALSHPHCYYWLIGERGTMSALAAVTSGFAAAASERLLGGDLNQPAEDAEPTPLNHQIAGVIVDAITNALDRTLAKRARSGAANEAISGKRGARSAAQAFDDLDPMQTQCITLNLTLGDIRAPGAIRLFFTAAYLDRLGLGGDARPQPRRGANDHEWSKRLRNNLLHTELPLTAVLGRIGADVGSLSRLQIGQVFELQADAINSLEISAPTENGPTMIARARLGSYQSNKAIKLTTPIDPAFIRGL